MKGVISIPARYGSTRFPGKPLAVIGGKTMLNRVVDIAREICSEISDISYFVATDDDRIADHAAEIGAPYIMTPESCATGSDRALAAIEQLDDKPDFVVNLQGDAPFTPKKAVKALIEALISDAGYEVVTPVHQLSWDDLDRLRESKKTTPFSGTTAVLNADGQALWFSKNIMPAIRKEDKLRAEGVASPVYQHMGLYGYRVDALKKFCALPEGHYEALEGLEQLRMIENGIKVQAIKIELENGRMQSGIDTPQDLERAEARLKSLES